MGRLSLAWLGAPSASHDGQRIDWPTRKTLALLIYVSANAGLQPREKLTALLWPESDAAQGRASLRRSLAFLRRALGHAKPDGAGRSAEHLLVERDAIGFNFEADFALDLNDLQAAARAARQLALAGAAERTPAALARLQAAGQQVRGDFLEGFSLKDAPAFDDWASAQREYYRRQAVGVFDHLSRLLAEAGESAAASEAAARWAALEPLDEQAAARLMQLHLAHGDRPAALTLYETFRQRLAAELRVEPAPETQALAERIRAGYGQSPVPPAPTAAASGARLPAKALEAPLVGRAAQFGQLVEAYHLARGGRLQVVVLQGEAGIGKSRLAAEFLGWAAAQGASVLQGRAFETGGALPYQLMVEALRSGLADPALLRGRLTDVWLSELARLLPELQDAFPDLVVRPAEDAAQAQLFEAVARLGETLARRAPLVLFLDDVQWADAASLDLLHYVGRRWAEGGAPVLIVAALRDEPAPALPAAATWLASAARDLPLRRLPLAALTPPDTLQIVEALGLAQPAASAPEAGALAGFSRWLFGETAGQPLFLIETLKALLDRGLLVAEPGPGGAWRIDFARAAQPEIELRGLLPPGVRELIRSRLTRLPPAALALLGAAAVLGRQASFDRLRQVSGLNEDEALAALEGLLAGRLLRAAAPDRYAFSHDKIRDVAYAEAGAPRQQVYHRRALELLAQARAPAGELAHHALLAGLAQPASHYSIAAGDDALALFAARDAIAHYEQGLSLMEAAGAMEEARPEMRHLLAQLGRAYDLNGELGKAQHTYERLLALAQAAGDAPTQRLALNRLATLVAQAGGNFPRALELLQVALGVAEAANDLAGLAETEWNLAQMGFYTWDEAHVLDHALRAQRLAQDAGGRDLIARSQNVLGLAYWVLGRFEDSENHSRLAQQLYAELGNRIMEADSQCVLAEAQIRLGQSPAAIDTARLAYTTGRELQNPWGQIGAACRLSLAFKETGQLAVALAVADDAVNASRAVDAQHWLVLTLCLRGSIDRDLHDYPHALMMHLEAQAVSEGRVSPIFKVIPGAHLCADYAAVGDWDQAARWVPPPPSWGELTLCQGLTRWYAVEALVRQGQLERAQADVRAFAAQAAGNRRYRIPYLRCAAVLAAAGGQVATAAAQLSEAAALAQQIGLPIEERNARAAMRALAIENKSVSM